MADILDGRQTTWYLPPPTGEDTLQFFKEERVEGAIYNVYLKKVRYHTPDDVGTPQPVQAPPGDASNSQFYLSIAAQDANDKGTFLQWSLEEIRVIKYGTLDRLVENLSSGSGDIDSTYVNIFLATYRSFASPKQVLNLLFERYRQISEDRKIKQHIRESHKKSIKLVLLMWLDTYQADFREPPNFPCLTSLGRFAQTHLAGSELEIRALGKVAKFIQEEEPRGPISVDDVCVELEQQLTLVDRMDYYLEDGNLLKFTDFHAVPVKTFAEQLTYLDSELFKKVVPHHCLGSVWSRRDKKRHTVSSVMATVDQFNSVSYRVVATVLKRPDLPHSVRVKVIEKWIDIAQELRVLKNFSSLKAILSGLQCNAVFRLKPVWAELERDRLDLFEELADIFSEENNQIMSRELLILEGTAKFADPESTNTIRGHKRRQSLFNTSRRKSTFFEVPPTAQGTIPYLGTFLTDLTMLDTANPDHTEDGLINFEKKRKEFEILAQIRLLQSAAHMYRIAPDRGFFEWFYGIRTYDDKESYELSCDIEPAAPATPKESKGHRKKPSLGFFAPRNPTGGRDVDADTTSITTSASSPGLLLQDDTTSLHSNPELDNLATRPAGLRHSVSVGAFSLDGSDISTSPWSSPEQRVVKVYLDTEDAHHSNNYKSIRLTNSAHTKTVISNILLKFNIDQSPSDFIIAQLLPGNQELQIPDKGNVFYAINSDISPIKFVMRRKSELERLKNRHLKGKGKRKKITF